MNDEILKKLNEIQQAIAETKSPWLDCKQASQYLRLSVSQIRKLIAKNEIPFNRASGKLLLNRKALDLWILNNSEKTTFTKRDKQKAEILL